MVWGEEREGRGFGIVLWVVAGSRLGLMDVVWYSVYTVFSIPVVVREGVSTTTETTTTTTNHVSATLIMPMLLHCYSTNVTATLGSSRLTHANVNRCFWGTFRRGGGGWEV